MAQSHPGRAACSTQLPRISTNDAATYKQGIYTSFYLNTTTTTTSIMLGSDPTGTPLAHPPSPSSPPKRRDDSAANGCSSSRSPMDSGLLQTSNLYNPISPPLPLRLDPAAPRDLSFLSPARSPPPVHTNGLSNAFSYDSRPSPTHSSALSVSRVLFSVCIY